MRDYNRRGGGRDDRRGGGDRQMHRATCADCGRDCEVPFRPTGNKPVYCSDCFKRDDDRGGRDRGGRDDYRGGGRGRDNRRDDRGSRGDRQMYDAVCGECGMECEVPFKPSGDKPVFCSECFGGGDSGRGGAGGAGGKGKSMPDQSGKKHDEILAKLDKILFLLQRKDPVREITVAKDEKGKKKAEKKIEKEEAKKYEGVVVKKVVIKKKKAVKKKAPVKKKAK